MLADRGGLQEGIARERELMTRRSLRAESAGSENSGGLFLTAAVTSTVSSSVSSAIAPTVTISSGIVAVLASGV